MMSNWIENCSDVTAEIMPPIFLKPRFTAVVNSMNLNCFHRRPPYCSWLAIICAAINQKVRTYAAISVSNLCMCGVQSIAGGRYIVQYFHAVNKLVPTRVNSRRNSKKLPMRISSFWSTFVFTAGFIFEALIKDRVQKDLIKNVLSRSFSSDGFRVVCGAAGFIEYPTWETALDWKSSQSCVTNQLGDFVSATPQ